jgi:hypothetical protein
MGRRGLLAGAVVLVGIALWFVSQDPGSATEAPQADDSSSPAAPEAAREPVPVAEREPRPAAAQREGEADPENPAAPAAPSQAPATPQPDDLAPMPAPERSGPVAELTRAFEKEPRDSAAQQLESRIESEFRKSDVAPGLLKSVLCRESVCRVEVRWTPERAVAFMSAFTRLSADFEPEIAIDPRGVATAREEELQVDVYLPRRGPGATPPAR